MRMKFLTILVKFRKDYFDIVRSYYGGSATNLDFIGDTESSRLVINEWVEERTIKMTRKNRISELHQIKMLKFK